MGIFITKLYMHIATDEDLLIQHKSDIPCDGSFSGIYKDLVISVKVTHTGKLYYINDKQVELKEVIDLLKN